MRYQTTWIHSEFKIVPRTVSCAEPWNRKNRAREPGIISIGLISMLFSVTSMQAGEIRVDASRKIGAIRIIHGINGAPICYGAW